MLRRRPRREGAAMIEWWETSGESEELPMLCLEMMDVQRSHSRRRRSHHRSANRYHYAVVLLHGCLNSRFGFDLHIIIDSLLSLFYHLRLKLPQRTLLNKHTDINVQSAPLNHIDKIFSLIGICCN